jgi:hypothetical protein
LEEKVAAPVQTTEITVVGIRYADHKGGQCCPEKLAITSPTSGGRSVGIVRPQIQATELLLVISQHLSEGDGVNHENINSDSNSPG